MNKIKNNRTLLSSPFLFLFLLFTLSFNSALAESQSVDQLLQNEVYPYQEANGGILPMEEITLGQTSSNYSQRTPSGNSSVYFYIPTEQPNITHSDFTSASRSLWNGKWGVSKVTALVMDESGVQHEAILRVQKRFNSRWLKMNDGVQRGYGQVRVSFNAQDNPSLAAGIYQGEFMIIGAGWHDGAAYRVAIKSKVSFKVGQVLIGKVSGNTADFNSYAKFKVKLSSKPTDNVTIRVHSSDESEGMVADNDKANLRDPGYPIPDVTDQIELVFTPENYNRNQTVTVRGRNSNVANGVQDYTIITSNTYSSDPAYDNLEVPDVPMRGIVLELSVPTKINSAIANIKTKLEIPFYYTSRSENLTFSLVQAPNGMTINSKYREIYWTPQNSDEGKDFNITVGATDGDISKQVSFNISVADGTPLQFSIQGDTLTIDEPNNSLNGISFKKVSGEVFAPIDINFINKSAEPEIPSNYTKLTDVFAILSKIRMYGGDEIEIRLPVSLIPEESTSNLRLFYYETNATGRVKFKSIAGTKWQAQWRSVGWISTSLEEDFVVIRSHDIVDGLYFIGIKERIRSPSQNTPLSKKTLLNHHKKQEPPVLVVAHPPRWKIQ